MRKIAFPTLRLCLALALAGSCYHAEVDLTRLKDEDVGAASRTPAADGSAGAGGAPDCDSGPLDVLQRACSMRLATAEECRPPESGSWSGCYGNACSVCTKSVRDYPYYFVWHPCCDPNASCNSNTPKRCNERCPPPSARDRVMPCSMKDLTP
jgi:hypothetical protein